MYKGLRAVVSFCFEKTELRRLWARVADCNTASCKILEKCGFKEEGLVWQGKMMHAYCAISLSQGIISFLLYAVSFCSIDKLYSILLTIPKCSQ